jgi:RNA polymerase sigma factor (sigma-70 family)
LAGAQKASGGTTLVPSAPVEVMNAPRTAPAFGPSRADSLLHGFAREGDRGRALRAQLAGQFPARSSDEIEDAVQQACQAFLEEGDGISSPDRAYAWIRTAAYRHLIHEVRRENRMVPVDPTEGALERAASDDPGPAAELIAIEDDQDLAVLVEQVAGSLSGRRRQILALWAIGLKRPEIASRLGVSERSVKRDLIAIMDEARSVLSREVGGGCLQGEPLIARLIYGLASGSEAEQAHRHLERCGRCSAFAERLEAWQSKAGALLPVPAAEAASPGVIERIVGRAGHAIGSARRQILGGGAQALKRASANLSRSVKLRARQ